MTRQSVEQVAKNIYDFGGAMGFYGGFTIDLIRIIVNSLVIAFMAEIARVVKRRSRRWPF
jgi:hypothetical protein